MGCRFFSCGRMSVAVTLGTTFAAGGNHEQRRRAGRAEPAVQAASGRVAAAYGPLHPARPRVLSRTGWSPYDGDIGTLSNRDPQADGTREPRACVLTKKGTVFMSSLALATIVQFSLLGAEESDFYRAYQQSVETGQPLVVLIGADWCAPCQQMKNSTLPQVAKAGGLRHVVFTYVDADRQPELVSKLSRAKSIPQLIRFDKTPSGWKGELLAGARSAEEVQAFLAAGVGRATRPGKHADSDNDKRTDDYASAYHRSIASGHPLVVLLGARWCPACLQMKNSVLPQVAQAGGLKNVEFAYVDLDLQPDLASQLSRGNSVPQLIRFEKGPAGWSSRTLVGFRSSSEVQSFVTSGPSGGAPAGNRARSPQGTIALSTN